MILLRIIVLFVMAHLGFISARMTGSLYALANGAYFTSYQDWTDADWHAARERIASADTAAKAPRGAS